MNLGWSATKMTPLQSLTPSLVTILRTVRRRKRDRILVDFSKIKPPRKPTSPQAIVRSPEFLEAAQRLNPLALLGRHPDEMIFSDIDFRGRYGVAFPPKWTNLLEEEPLIKRILEERNLEELFGEGGFSIVGKSSVPQRGKPSTFRTALHEQGHIAFMKDKELRKGVLTPEGKLPRFGNGEKIGEEDLLKIIEIRNGLEHDFKERREEEFGPGIISSQMAYLRKSLGNLELTNKNIFEDKSVKELLKRLDYEIGRRLNIPKPIRVGVGR
jgi:hypothetical protein